MPSFTPFSSGASARGGGLDPSIINSALPAKYYYTMRQLPSLHPAVPELHVTKHFPQGGQSIHHTNTHFIFSLYTTVYAIFPFHFPNVRPTGRPGHEP
jgi:hypothetical protein